MCTNSTSLNPALFSNIEVTSAKGTEAPPPRNTRLPGRISRGQSHASSRFIAMIQANFPALGAINYRPVSIFFAANPANRMKQIPLAKGMDVVNLLHKPTMKNLSHSHLLTALASSTFSCGILFAEIRPNPLFSDGAVLQRDQAVPIWGTARDGEKVTVELCGQKATTVAEKGVWRVELKPLRAGGPFTLTFTGDNSLTLNNILVGEVWICSGQSNMEWGFDRAANAAEERPKAVYPKIRMYTVAKKVSMKPLTEAPSTWVECSPEKVGGFSAVGYFFARDLYQKLGIPVGMIHTSWGGTPAQAWTSIEGLGSDPKLKGYLDAANAALANYPAAMEAYPVKLAEFKAAKEVWDETVGKPYQLALKTWTEESAKAKEAGQSASAKPQPASKAPAPPTNPEGGSNKEANLFNAMIHPLVPYAIKGAIWYQGESNASQSLLYQTLFPAMIADWRTRWKQGDFPFLFVQIAPFGGQPPEIREAQFLTLSKSPNTAMAVTTDVGDAKDIHPTRKEPVGQRLALAARALAYGEKVEYSGPLYQSMQVKGEEVILSFTHTGSGLVARDGELKGFTLAGADGKFVPATAKIDGSNILVTASGVTDPKAVRYGWENVPDVNLFNHEGLPASPFRTDLK
jgi:sialate O-acetylesterase